MAACSSIGGRRVLGDVLDGDRRDRLIRPTLRCTRHGGDDAQIRVEGDVVEEVSGDDDEDEPAMETVQTRETDYDTSRRPLDGASGLVARSV